MKTIDRIDQQPTAVDQPLLRLRHVYQDRHSGKGRRMGFTCMDPAMDRRKGERRRNTRRKKERRQTTNCLVPTLERRKSERRRKIAWFFRH